jgi:predicted ABC-type ATPase
MRQKNVHKSIGVETVLSTAKYRRLVEKAKRLGLAVWLFYVVLDSPERSIERIKIRVRKGVTRSPTRTSANVMAARWSSSRGFSRKRIGVDLRQ